MFLDTLRYIPNLNIISIEYFLTKFELFTNKNSPNNVLNFEN